MLYFLLILFGIIVACLLFFQLRNEANAQSNQIKNILGNLVLEAHCPMAKEGKTPFALLEQTETQTYPVISTSITCGKKDDRKRYQVDFPLETTDEQLKGTAVEFFVEADNSALQLYVRNVEQPIIWIVGTGRTSLCGVLKAGEEAMFGALPGESEISLEEYLPSDLKSITENRECFIGKAPVYVGDEIRVGNTRIVLTYGKGDS